MWYKARADVVRINHGTYWPVPCHDDYLKNILLENENKNRPDLACSKKASVNDGSEGAGLKEARRTLPGPKGVMESSPHQSAS